MKKWKLPVLVSLLLVLPLSFISAQSSASGTSGRRSSSYTLTINTNVKGAQVFINGTLQKVAAPGNIALAPGNYSVTLKAPGYVDASSNVRLTQNTTLSLNLTPVSYTLTVRSNAKGAQVYLNGALQPGSVPFTATLPPGSYTVMLKADKWEDGSINVTLNGNQAVNLNLKKARAMVTAVLADPNIMVFLDGKQEKNNPFRIEEGEHEITFSLGALSVTQTVTFEAGVSYTITPALTLFIE